MTAAYFADTDALGLGRPDARAAGVGAEMMGPIVDYIGRSDRPGHAYESRGDVFFRVRSDPGYG